VDISTRVHDNHDRGLLGLAIHPDFPQAPYVYLLYTHDPVGATPDQASPVAGRVAQLLRVEADPSTGFVTAKPGTEVVLLGSNSTLANIGQEDDGRNTAFASCMTGRTMAGAPVEDCIPSDENSHTVGSLVFGPDKTLFVSNGDGSNYGGVDPRALRALNRDSLAGKVLRIDPISGEGLPDNPFFDPQAPDRNLSKVWAYGLRNPFRMTVDQATGSAYIGDVGWNTWEEINTGKGANFGWPCYEGGAVSGSESGDTTSRQQGSYRTNTETAATCNALYAEGVSAVRAPTFAYDHSAGGASANAGTVYEGDTYPAEYDGALFIADYNRRWIRYLTFDDQGRATVHPFGQENTASGPVQVITGPDKNLYWMRYNSTGGEVRRVRYVAGGNTPPVAIVQADVTIGLTPLTVSFNSNDSYDPDAQALSYSWDFGDGGTSAERNPTHTFTQPGVYDATLTLTETTTPFASSSESVRITVGNNPPLADITSPADGTTYAIGDVLDFTGEASAGGSPLPASAMTWEVRQLHNEHVHYSTPASGPQPGNPNVSTDTQCIDLFPRKTPYTITTEPVGLKVNYQDEGWN